MSSTFPCPKCNGNTGVKDSRAAAGAQVAVRRRRNCHSCGHRFTTYEQESDGSSSFTVQLDALAKQAATVLAQSEAMMRQTDDLQRLSAAWREIEEGRRGS